MNCTASLTTGTSEVAVVAPPESQLSSPEEILSRLARLERTFEEYAETTPDVDALNIVVFDGARDRLLAAFVIATGAAACGMKVTMFFTFWATPALRKDAKQFGKKTLIERAFGWMLPGGLRQTRLSQMDMLGIGRKLLENEMKRKNIADLPTLLKTAGELGVQISVCEMSMKLMGIRAEELIEYPDLTFCGVAKFVEGSAKANTTLFI